MDSGSIGTERNKAVVAEFGKLIGRGGAASPGAS
jgi:hypothetical protein